MFDLADFFFFFGFWLDLFEIGFCIFLGNMLKLYSMYEVGFII